MTQDTQYIGDKLQALVKTKELKQYSLAKEMGITFTHFSKKVGNKDNFSPDQIKKAAAFLGVKSSFLYDEARVYNIGDEIPPDAIAQPATESADSANAFFDLIAHRVRAETKHETELMRETLARMEAMMKEQFAALSTKVEALSDENAGDHDPDN